VLLSCREISGDQAGLSGREAYNCPECRELRPGAVYDFVRKDAVIVNSD